MRHFLVYSVIRLALFFAIWGLLTLTLPIGWQFTGVLAAVVAMLISILFLGRFRQDFALDVQRGVEARQEKRAGRVSEYDEDAVIEDGIIDHSR